MTFLDIFARVMPYVNTAAITVFTLKFFSSVYPKRFTGRFAAVPAFLVMFTITVAVNSFGVPHVNAICNLLLINSIAFVMYKPKITTGLVYNQLFMMTVMMSDVITAYVSSARYGMTMERFLSDEQTFAVAVIVNITVMFVTTRILALFLQKTGKWKIRASEIIILIMMIVFELYIVISIYGMTRNLEDVHNVIIIIVGFVVLNIVTTFEIQKISELYKSKYDADIARQQTELELSHYNDLSASRDSYRAVIHDIRKHLSTLTAMSKNQSEEFYDYARTISERMERLFDEFRCQNRVLSIIMTQKIRAAERENIRLILQIEDLELDFMRETDITAIFANLWDNAIEAVRELPESGRVIKVSLIAKNNFVMARFENSYEGEIESDGSTYLSKKGKGHTGSGLNIVRSAAESYGGRVVIKSQNGEFFATVLLPMRERAALTP